MSLTSRSYASDWTVLDERSGEELKDRALSMSLEGAVVIALNRHQEGRR